MLFRSFSQYGTCELVQNLDSLTYFNGELVERLAGGDSVLRPGQEVFACTRSRPLGIGKTFLIVGILLSNRKTPLLNHVLLMDQGSLDLLEKGVSGIEQSVVRVCPIKYVGKVPGGKAMDTTQPLIEKYLLLCSDFFSTLQKGAHDLSEFDLAKPQIGRAHV